MPGGFFEDLNEWKSFQSWKQKYATKKTAKRFLTQSRDDAMSELQQALTNEHNKDMKWDHKVQYAM